MVTYEFALTATLRNENWQLRTLISTVSPTLSSASPGTATARKLRTLGLPATLYEAMAKLPGSADDPASPWHSK
jgi:hypothetical protein